MIIGVDPGLTGGLALISPQGRVLEAIHTPTFKIGSKLDLDERLMAQWAQNIRAMYPDVRAVVEQVGPMPKQGVTSMFNFGGVYRATRMALVAANIPYGLVTPQKWKRAMGLTADKEEALRLASRLMPFDYAYWTPDRGIRTKEQCKGVAEAALIGIYAQGHRPAGVDIHL